MSSIVPLWLRHTFTYLTQRSASCLHQERHGLLLKQTESGFLIQTGLFGGFEVLELEINESKKWRFVFLDLCFSLTRRRLLLSLQSSRDLVCFVQFDNLNVYYGKDFKSRYKAPTDFCFVLKVSETLLRLLKAQSSVCFHSRVWWKPTSAPNISYQLWKTHIYLWIISEGETSCKDRKLRSVHAVKEEPGGETNQRFWVDLHSCSRNEINRMKEVKGDI